MENAPSAVQPGTPGHDGVSKSPRHPSAEPHEVHTELDLEDAYSELFSNINAHVSGPLIRKKQSKALKTSLVLLKIAGFVATVLVLVFVTVTLMIPRLAGWVSMTQYSTNLEPAISQGSEVLVRPVREAGAKKLQAGALAVYQTKTDPADYEIGRIDHIQVLGPNSYVYYMEAADGGEQKRVKLGDIRGVVLYAVPYVGFLLGWVPEVARSFALAALASLICIYGGWQMGTALANMRHPKTLARQARLQAAAAQGRLEADRHRLGRVKK